MNQPLPRNGHISEETRPRTKKTCGDLNFYLNFIMDNINLNPQNDESGGGQTEVFEENVSDVLKSISEIAQAKCWKFARAFQPILSGSNNKLKIEVKNGENHATVPLFLNYPLYPDMFEVRTGQLAGLPPGFALYQLRHRTSAEEVTMARKMWRGCLDKGDYVCPLKIYPWFAKAMLEAVIYLKERQPGCSQFRFRLRAVFPTVHLTIKVLKYTRMGLLCPGPSPTYMYPRGATSRSSGFRSRSGTPRDPYCGSSGTQYSMSTSLKADDLETYSVGGSKSTLVESLKRNSPDTIINDGEDGVDPASARDLDSRSSNVSTLDPQLKLGTLSADRDTTDIIHLHIIPSVEGFGWPKAARIPNLLPSQRPWSLMSTEWISEMKSQIKDGSSFWGLQAVDPKELGSMYPGRYLPLWRINYAATNDFMLLKINQMPVACKLDNIFEMLCQMNNGLGRNLWSLLGDRSKSDIKLTAIKEGVHVNETLSDWFLPILSSTITYLKKEHDSKSQEMNDTSKADDLEALIKSMEDLQLVCIEDPRKLLEMVNINNGNLLAPSCSSKMPEQQISYLRTSTPMDVPRTSRASAQGEKNVRSTKIPGKKPRMIYRLFRKDF